MVARIRSLRHPQSPSSFRRFIRSMARATYDMGILPILGLCPAAAFFPSYQRAAELRGGEYTIEHDAIFDG
jgi:hypothetical protein